MKLVIIVMVVVVGVTVMMVVLMAMVCLRIYTSILALQQRGHAERKGQHRLLLHNNQTFQDFVLCGTEQPFG